MLRDQRRTKIVCTLGPASDGDILPRLLEAGMNVARLNFSHGTQEEHGAQDQAPPGVGCGGGVAAGHFAGSGRPQGPYRRRCPGAKSRCGRARCLVSAPSP